MTKRDPKWRREGFSNEAEYKSACGATTKTRNAAFAATSAEKSALTILKTMWEKADHHRPYVTTTKQQMCEDAKVSRPTVQKAWRLLRREGSIVPVAGIYGGKGIPITFKLGVAKRDMSPSDVHDFEAEEAKRREAAFKYLAQKHGALEAMRILDAKKGEI